MSSSHATLSAAADDRKARLAKLRSIKRKQPGDEIVPPESDRVSPAVLTGLEDSGAEHTAEEEAPDVSRLHLSGRNYDPEARGAKLGFEAPPNLAAGSDTLEAKAADIEADIRRQQEEEDEADANGKDGGDGGAAAASSKGIDLFKLQPKKPNWDLKRELNKRLEPLNARTDRAISKIVRERLSAKQQSGQKQTQASASTGDDGQGALEGAAFVEGIRIREQEAEKEERREREAEEDE
ncbi:cwf18-like protein [Grosmannia clavigera kw1407]|uniref:Cwf18-like protein n=1 Tax=Grosmannia clavigera (strain kw1407 / UAMH 11150) TaxID=655863 RepID=F0XSM0_GROCL|nr:cwf18-like protein [Grosmannia clavigera kw1407]EFW99352.1 cwf18-like protein [Grosmannia clavigera kw1407]